MKFCYSLLICLALHLAAAQAQSLERTVETRLQTYFKDYHTVYARIGSCRLQRVDIDHQQRKINIYASPSFGYQPFTEQNTTAICRQIGQMLPGPVNNYEITVYADGKPIRELIPNAFRRHEKDADRLYGKIDSKEAPWVTNLSRPYIPSQGLEGRHIGLWASHGKFYRQDCHEWQWQRPRLFGTIEDLYTQSIVIPYLIPMLERAGAVVYTPRERDSQPHEVIVDNDTRTAGSRYLEVNHKKYVWTTAPGSGFAWRQARYTDGRNPFADGTTRMIPTCNAPEKAFAEWIPNIPEKGKYAVYVSYHTLPESVDDARYLVFHNGGVTEFKVNQRMGGGTWVYLGTFEFDKGTNDYCMVVLSNESAHHGVISADAVRFGGGMGNMERGGTTSGLPRYFEGARYWTQWAGMPYSVYSKSGGQNDYNDDINARSLCINYLSGGSVYNPSEPGLKVPIETTFALHSDAGFFRGDTLVGSLGIYTTDYNGGRLASGISRYASRDLTDMVLTGMQRDLSALPGINWARRSMWNRNYSETRLPAVPSMILETLSHQNFADMQLGYLPDFKFSIARSVYKSILKFLAEMHRTNYTVQPLPVSHFAISENPKKHTFELRWIPTDDPLEPTARPQGYIVYTRVGQGGFDNGTYVDGNSYSFRPEPGLVYSFRVTAVNRGGESFPSETLAAYRARKSRGTILIVNAFHRTDGPAQIHNTAEQGFDIAADPGIPYIGTTAFCGFQHNFDRVRPGIEAPDGLGYSGNELEGKYVAGNTFDYPFLHGKAIQAAGHYSFVSCSSETLESGSTDLSRYPIIDLIYGGEQKPLGQNTLRAINKYCRQGGNLLISGTHLLRMADSAFLQQTLKFTWGGDTRQFRWGEVFGTGIRFRIPLGPNEQTYAVPAPDCILPAQGAFTSFIYTDGNQGAGVAYRGDYCTFILGFPFECIPDPGQRTHIMRAALHFLDSGRKP